jgi:hypothetical protein
MKSILVLAALSGFIQLSVAQGSGAPAPEGQAVTAKGEASAESAVQGRHDKALAHSKARAAKRAAKAASAASH